MGHLLSIGIFIHIIGITCIAGGSVGGLILETHMWRYVHARNADAIALVPLLLKFPIIIQAGTILMLLSGLLMLYALGWVVAGQWWFIIKMVLVVLLVVNGAVVAKPVSQQLSTLVPAFVQGKPVGEALQAAQKKMVVFHITELTMLLAVYLLAVFQF